jgi:hypothetical protein
VLLHILNSPVRAGIRICRCPASLVLIPWCIAISLVPWCIVLCTTSALFLQRCFKLGYVNQEIIHLFKEVLEA